MPIHSTSFTFSGVFNKVFLCIVDIIIKHSIYIEKSSALVLFLQIGGYISGQHAADISFFIPCSGLNHRVNDHSLNLTANSIQQQRHPSNIRGISKDFARYPHLCLFIPSCSPQRSFCPSHTSFCIHLTQLHQVQCLNLHLNHSAVNRKALPLSQTKAG